MGSRVLLLNFEDAPENMHLETALARASGRPGAPALDIAHGFRHEYDFIPRAPGARVRRLPAAAAAAWRRDDYDAAVFVDIPWRPPAFLRWLDWLAGSRARRRVLVFNHLYRAAGARASAAAGALRRFDRLYVFRHDDAAALSRHARPGALALRDYALDCRYYAPQPAVEPDGLVLSAGSAHRDYALLAAALADAGLRARVFCDGPEAAPLLEAGVEVASLNENLDRLRAALAAARLVAVPTRPTPLDGAGLTVALMGLAMGKPVVARDTPVMRRYIEHGVGGFLYEGGRRESLARALCAADAAAGDAGLSRRARRVALALANLDRFAERLLGEAGARA